MCHPRPRLIVSAAALAVSVALASCGTPVAEHDMGAMPSPAGSSAPSASGSATPAAGPHNDADVMFATRMIPHHNQAIEMSGMMLAKTDIDPQVAALARRIKDAQSPEVAQLAGWLAGWGAEPGMGGMDHGDSDDGMVTEAEMAELNRATGEEATTLFLDDMIKHHTGAIATAQTELDQGVNPDAKKLAQAVVDAQETEITEMEDLAGF